MVVSGWKGGTLGIYVGVPNRNTFFDRSWNDISVVIDGLDHRIPLTPSFWDSCPELRGGVIRYWLERQGVGTWAKGQPPYFELVPLGGPRFRLDHPAAQSKIIADSLHVQKG